jgi:hypothetical protein
MGTHFILDIVIMEETRILFTDCFSVPFDADTPQFEEGDIQRQILRFLLEKGAVLSQKDLLKLLLGG